MSFYPPSSQNFETKRRIMETFDSMGGALYEALYKEEQEKKYNAFLCYLKPLEGVALDNGCGTGLLMNRLRIDVVGLDLSAALLSKARLKCERGRHLVRGDAENLPFRDNIYRYVFAVTLINNTPNSLRAVKEMMRVSKKGASLIVTALKKSFSEDGLLQFISQSGLKPLSTPLSDGLKDWIVIATPQAN